MSVRPLHAQSPAEPPPADQQPSTLFYEEYKFARLASDQGELKAAAEHYQRALDILDKLALDTRVRAAYSLEMARGLSNLGTLAKGQGELKAAAEYYQRALDTQEKLAPNSSLVPTSLNNLGNVAQDQGDLKAAEEYFRRALSWLSNFMPDSPGVAASLINLGSVAEAEGDMKAAAEYYQRALTIRAWAPNALDVAARPYNRDILERSQRDLEMEAQGYQRALDIGGWAPESLDMAASLINLGAVAEDQGDLKAATEYYQRALDIRDKMLDVAAILNNLGNVAMKQRDLKAAAENHRRALDILDKLAPDSLAVATTLHDLGVVAYIQRDLGAASDYYQRALDIRDKLEPDSLYVAWSLSNLGAVEEEKGDLKAASDYYQRALDIREKLAPDSPGIAEILSSLGTIAMKSGRLEIAENFAERAWRIVQHDDQQVASDETRQIFGSVDQHYVDPLVSIRIARGEAEAAFETLEEGRAQALARLLFERREVLRRVSGDLWTQHQKALTKLHSAEETLDKLERVPDTSMEVEQQWKKARTAYLQATNVAYEMWAEIQKKEPRAFVTALQPAEAGKALGTTKVFVEFSLESDGAYVFVIRGGDAVKILAKKLQLNPASYRDRVWGFWERVGKQPASGGEAAKAAQSELAAEGLELFDLLFPGEIGEVVRKSKRLIISPDGPLWQLPFAAMVTNVDANGTPHYLAERVSISYAPSLALYAQTNKEARPLHHGQRPEAVVVGDPDFDRKVELDPNDPEAERLWAGLYPPGSRPERLKATAREAALIGQLYESDPLTGENATEAELRKRIERADVIHLATHGSFQLARPMSSGIMLAPPAKEPSIGDTNNDGALQAWEIFSQLNLRAELVVLSACETARGGVVRGEGIVGLTRALQYAGAKSIVATQWKVSGGDSTAELMVEFHKNLREAKAKDEALKDAMAVVRKEHPQPFFWAPFILLGDPDNPNLGRN